LIRVRDNRLLSIDALRGIAALMVLFYHNLSPYVLDWKASQPARYWAGFPVLMLYSGVHLFLVLSGFCIHLRFARQRPPRRIDFTAFWRRRLHRLYPPYVAAVFFGVLLVTASTRLLPGPPPLPAGYAGWRALGLDIGAHLLMLQLFWAETFSGLYNGPLWSLALEEQLYALYAPLLRLRRHLGWEGMIGWTLAVTLVWRIVAIFNPWHRGLPLLPPIDVPRPWTLDLRGMIWLSVGPARWFEWALGAFAVEAHCGNLDLPRLARHPMIGGALLVAASLASLHPLGWIVNDMLFAGGYFVLLNAFCRVEKERPGELRENSLVVALASVGLWSYSLYLTHAPVLRSTHNLLNATPWRDSPLLHAILPLLAALAVGRAFFAVVERRFLSASRAAHHEESRPA
jgi:peptidoglycan/LPS O-acetylase OafA/YrhL